MDQMVFARFYVLPKALKPDRISIPAHYLDQTTFHWPKAPADAGVLSMTPIGSDPASEITDYKVRFETEELAVIRKQLILEDVGPVWHLWLDAKKVKQPTKIEEFRKTPGAMLFGILGVVALMYLLVFVVPFLQAPFETMGKVIYHLKSITSVIMVGFSILTGVWLIWQQRFLLAGVAVLSFVPATFVFFSFYGLLLQPEGLPGQDGYTYRQYLFDFVAAQSYGLQFLAPIMPVLTFFLQAVGLKVAGDILKTTIGLTADGGTMEEFVVRTKSRTRGDGISMLEVENDKNGSLKPGADEEILEIRRVN